MALPPTVSAVSLGVLVKLISELNDLLAHNDDFNSLESDDEKRQYVKGLLSPESSQVYRDLPKGIARQLTLDRDPHGNVQVSLIETEKLLIEMVAKRLALLKAEGKYKGAPLRTFIGDKFVGGYSDHLPVYIMLTLKKK